MKERKERSIFVPGMQCPGGCGKKLETRDDLYKKVVLCKECGGKYHREYQRSRAYSAGLRCQCGARMANASKSCVRCSMRAIATRPAEAKPGGKPIDRSPAVFAGLRGEGGEMAAVLAAGIPYRTRHWGAKPC